MSSWIYRTIKLLMLKITTLSPNNAKPIVVCSQSKELSEKTFYHSGRYFPTDLSLFENYIKRRKEYDKKHKSIVNNGWMSEESYNNWRHYYALGVDSLK